MHVGVGLFVQVCREVMRLPTSVEGYSVVVVVTHRAIHKKQNRGNV